MVVQHNLLAMNADRQLNIVNKSTAKNVMKLASGYRINSAADDAAGLAISEKLRRQIRGLTRGAENLQDGVSFTQVADGALNEVSDILHRINELSVQAANGTQTDTDRDYIQEEVSAQVEEIKRIIDTTSFNERPIWNTDYSGLVNNGPWKINAGGEYISLNGGKESIKGKTKTDSVLNNIKNSLTSLATSSSSRMGNIAMYFSSYDGASRKEMALSVSLTLDQATKDSLLSPYLQADGTTKMMADPDKVEAKAKQILAGIASQSFNINSEGYMASDISIGAITGKATLATSEYKEVGFQWGPESDANVKAKYNALNIGILGISDTNVTSEVAARQTISSIKHAQEVISEQRSVFGAYQNRFEHSINNIDNVVENTTAAESRLRDTDMAKMMVEFSKNNILKQAGQAMLAQANESKQGILALLG